MTKNYELRQANNNDIKFVKRAKIATIFQHAHNITKDEKLKILNYIDSSINDFLCNYNIILLNGKKCGVFLFRDFEDGTLLDEIFLLPKYRGLGIGSGIIQNEVKKYAKVYLWVYKDNVKAIKLYSRLGFCIYKKTNNRYLMLYENKDSSNL